MKIRLMGTEAEINLFIQTLDEQAIYEISDFYPNRGNSKLGRVYIETYVKTEVKKFTDERLPKIDDQDMGPKELVIPYHREHR